MRRPVLLGVLVLAALATAVALLPVPDTGGEVPAQALPGAPMEGGQLAPTSLAPPPPEGAEPSPAPEQAEPSEPVAPSEGVDPTEGVPPEIVALQEARKAPHGMLMAGQLSSWTALYRELVPMKLDPELRDRIHIHVKSLQMARLAPQVDRALQLRAEQREILAHPDLRRLAEDPDVRTLLDRLDALDAEYPLD